MAPKLSSLLPGTYIVAVSGGVDSMTLLTLLRQQPGLTIIVAHANHGIRDDSDADETLVSTFCKSHNIPFIVKKLHLDKNASEDEARKARYAFLRQCRKKYNAKAILTAHHKDDLIETALINLIRGTGWRGIAPFYASSDIVRPLLDVSKNQIKAYALQQGIAWREDTTNTDEHYLRNYIRHTLVPVLSKHSNEWQEDFMRLIRNQQALRRTIEQELKQQLAIYISVTAAQATLQRYEWIMLPQPIAYELFQALCREHIGNSLVRELALQALLFIKTAKPGKKMSLNNKWQLRATRSQIIVEPPSVVVS
jgi:tRNA(Ile)-lysidine synthase